MAIKTILGIETSCDETAAAVLRQDNGKIQILSNIVASSALIQSKYGGIIPEQAAREQLKSIIPVIETALSKANLSSKEIDAIAVTSGPGLIGSLLVGTETAKVLSLIWNKPLIPVNHLIGHFYANWIEQKPGSMYHVLSIKQKKHNTKYIIPNTPSFPCLGLLVSGGHTDLVLFKNHGQYEYLGGTRDDAAGECFDKCARLLGLPYPGGPEISKLAKNGNPKAFNLPRPMHDSGDFDFSFSGLKTAVANLVMSYELGVMSKDRTHHPLLITHDLAASIEAAIIDTLVKKTIKAAKLYQVKTIILGGGVTANEKLVSELKVKTNGLKINLHVPTPNLCTDNAAMIAAAGFFEKPLKHPLDLQANLNLSLFN